MLFGNMQKVFSILIVAGLLNHRAHLKDYHLFNRRRADQILNFLRAEFKEKNMNLPKITEKQISISVYICPICKNEYQKKNCKRM